MKHKLIIFSDYTWPFCYIGKGIVDELKKEYTIEQTLSEEGVDFFWVFAMI